MTNLNNLSNELAYDPLTQEPQVGVRITNFDDLESLTLTLDPSSFLAALREPVRYAGSSLLTCAAATDYAAGDVLSASASNNVGAATYVDNLARSAGGVVNLSAVRALCNATNGLVVAQIRLHWFTGAPAVAEVEMDDNAVFAINTAAGAAKWVGSILLNPLVDRGSFSTSDTPLSPIESYRCASGLTGLFYVAVLENAETNESAGMTINFDFYCL